MLSSLGRIRSLFFFAILLSSVLFVGGCRHFSEDESVTLRSRNVILIIGDGMGPEQVKAAGFYEAGKSGCLSFEQFPYKTEMSTYSQNFFVTDSAAAATAMATGQKVLRGVVSRAIPGSGKPLRTLLEIAAANGKRTGLVTTTLITHASPAVFASHVRNRHNYEEIGKQYLTFSRPNVLFGGGDSYLTPAMAKRESYAAVVNRTELLELQASQSDYYLGYFGTGHMPYMYDGMGNLPELSDMALKAIELLEQEEDGFFLMVEAGRIDHAGHENDLIRNIHEVLELSDTVEQIMHWAEGREDTLIIVTADHETGGLTVLENNGKDLLPTVRWKRTGHTGIPVPVYLWGEGAEQSSVAIRDNTDIFQTLTILGQ